MGGAWPWGSGMGGARLWGWGRSWSMASSRAAGGRDRGWPELGDAERKIEGDQRQLGVEGNRRRSAHLRTDSSVGVEPEALFAVAMPMEEGRATGRGGKVSSPTGAPGARGAVKRIGREGGRPAEEVGGGVWGDLGCRRLGTANTGGREHEGIDKVGSIASWTRTRRTGDRGDMFIQPYTLNMMRQGWWRSASRSCCRTRPWRSSA